jgi:peptidoglycan hydrolase-like protein with peptidoglycan-binding domain
LPDAGATQRPAYLADFADLAAASKAPASRGRTAKVIGLVVAITVLLGAAVFYYYTHAGRAQAADPPGGNPRGQSQSNAPESVVSVTPATGTVGVNGAADITVSFAEPLSPTSPMPTVTPSIKGTWQRSGNSAVFHPERGFRPRTKVTVTIPGGNAGVQSAGGGLLAAPVTVQFRTGQLQRVRIEQVLAQLGYLPLTWAPLTGQAAPLTSPNAQLSAAYSPPQGTYTWQPGYPSALHHLWRPDRPSEILKGAVMAFEADHGLALDGVIGPAVWHAMFRALSRDAVNKHGYTYALERQKLPEILTVWHDGKIVFRHLSNTGISIRPTAVQTDPVYLRYRHQIMKGRNPNGTKYADPVAWVAYFHNGEAIHYFPRGSYGWPQSLGCIELPYAPAEQVWPYLTFGTLVTVLPA